MAENRKQELIRELDVARAQLRTARVNLSDSYAQRKTVGDRLKSNLSRFRGLWLSGAVLTGLAIAKLPARTKVKKVELKTRKQKVDDGTKQAGKAGLAIASLSFVFNLIRPLLLNWLKGQLTTRLRTYGYR